MKTTALLLALAMSTAAFAQVSTNSLAQMKDGSCQGRILDDKGVIVLEKDFTKEQCDNGSAGRETDSAHTAYDSGKKLPEGWEKPEEG